MSAAKMQKETPEVSWSGLEALGLSPRELVLAEALQMEYDALSRLRQDKSETETIHSPSCSSGLSAAGECSQSSTVLRGLSGSSPIPTQLGGSYSPPSIPPRVPPPHGDQTKQSLFILDTSEDNKDSNIGDLMGSDSECLNPPLDDTPPALPPRIPISQSLGSGTPYLLSQESSHNVNLFLPDAVQPKLASETTYDSINQALLRLNCSQGVAGSKTLPPQLPPRTHPPGTKRVKNPQPTDVVRA